jgi:hypothetical protein
MHISAPEDSKPLSRTEFEMETPGRAIGAPRDLGSRHFHRPSAEVVQQSDSPRSRNKQVALPANTRHVDPQPQGCI